MNLQTAECQAVETICYCFSRRKSKSVDLECTEDWKYDSLMSLVSGIKYRDLTCDTHVL